MKKVLFIILAISFCVGRINAQKGKHIISSEDISFLSEITSTVIDSSSVLPGGTVNDSFGPNNTGGTLILPGGRSCYPAFWIRDYALSLDCGLIPEDKQLHMLTLTAQTQCMQTWITKNGSLIPFGAIADHVRIDDALPIYFPGTYNFEEQGSEIWGKTPPYTDQYCFIHMAYIYVKRSGKKNILNETIDGYKLIDRLEWAFKVPPAHKNNQIVYTTKDFRGVDFGFRDAITILGDLSIVSVFKYRAAKELSEMFKNLRNSAKASFYSNIASVLKREIPHTFCNDEGLLIAGTEISRQGDVWSTALAVYFGILENKNKEKACLALAEGYKNKLLSYKGNIRHVMMCDDYNESTMWEGGGNNKGHYQNGAYWGTPVGWVCYAIAQVDEKAARELAMEYINDLKENDFRKGYKHGAPYECFNKDFTQNPLYLTTVSAPLDVFLKMINH